MRKLRALRLSLAGLVATLTVLGLAPASASSANISHSYQSDTSITQGSLVSLDPQHTNFVEPANTGNGSRLLGIAVASNDSLVAVDEHEGSVQVATTGSANALVSTVNGDIKVGDQIAVSPFDGIGMKALPGLQVIGLAQTPFSDQSGGAKTQQVTDKQGHTAQIKIGYVRVSIAVGTDVASGGTTLTSLQKWVQSLTGHVVSTTRIILSLVVAAVAILALVVLIYASIYSSIISIGRNPLAKYAVFRALTSVLGVAVLTTVVAGITIFFLLR